MSLDYLREEWCRELRGELPLRLHYAAVGGKSTKGGAAGDLGGIEFGAVPPTHRSTGNGGWTGLPFTRPFERYIDGEHGGDFIATDAFAAVRDWCRREHWRESHSTDNPFAWNLCARLVIAYVELRQPVPFIAAQEGLDLWLTENLLIGALRESATWRGSRRAGVVIGDESHKQLNESEALSVVLAHQHDLVYEEKVWNALRNESWCDCGGVSKWPSPSGEKHPVDPHSFMLSWEDETKRRRAFHAKWCHDRCGLLMADAA